MNNNLISLLNSHLDILYNIIYYDVADLSLSMGHFSSDFLHRVLSNVSSNCLPQKRHSHTGCICLTLLHYAFSSVSSNGLSEKRHSRIGCISLTFLHCAFSNVSSNGLPEKRQSHIGCIC